MFDQMTQVARACIGDSKYVLQTGLENAPAEVDCSSFTQWLFFQFGVDIPRLARDQHDACDIYLPARCSSPGDLVFRRCHYSRFKKCPILDIGHVGFVTTSDTVIHASWSHGSVVEEPLATYYNYKTRGLWTGRVLKGGQCYEK